MTFEEAKKILDEELCFVIEKRTDIAPVDFPLKFDKYEKLRVREAIIAMNRLGYDVYYDLDFPAYIYREKMLEREHNELLSSGTIEKMFDNRLKEKAEEFSDSLLDEQAKRIKELEATVENREEEIDILNDTMARRIKDIQDLKQTVKSDNSIIDKYEKKVKEMGKEIARLNKIINKKNEIIKEKNELNKTYANKLIDACDEIQALKERLKKIGELCDTKEGDEVKQEEIDREDLMKKALEALKMNERKAIQAMIDCYPACDYSRIIIFRK